MEEVSVRSDRSAVTAYWMEQADGSNMTDRGFISVFYESPLVHTNPLSFTLE